MESAKRKRDDDLPRITYHASGRTFDRLFKEKSLDETREVVRRKLGLQRGAVVKLKQLRGGKAIDLEDEDDFDAFRALARAVMSVDVRVTASTPADDLTSAEGASEADGVTTAPTPKTNSTQTADVRDGTPSVARTSKAPTPGSRRKVAFGNSSSSAAKYDSAEGSAPKTKKRKSGAASEATLLKSTLTTPLETPATEDDASSEPPTPIHPPKKNGRAKSNKASTNTGAEESGLTSAPVIPPHSTSNATRASAAETASEDLDDAAPPKKGRTKKGTKDVSGDSVVHDMDSGKRSGKKNAKEPRDAGVYVELPTSHVPSIQSPSVPRKKSKTPKERTATGENVQTTEAETAAKEPSKRTKVSAGSKKKEYATFDDETLKGIIASAAATTNAKALERMNSVRDSQPAETSM
ncbi:hypothetical protein BV22DRAFT_1039425 [Leucogyrophana mollusca]|uniref:Uncharacterized protein n=1 Tax=Leucogyrophana mollusca TaxID=85980 RepID=A0ACB8B6E5_9AGAM|nr:hypothetical protein BV22DRAFT_1039425 [Leucogyrophana mollusca]